MLGFGNFWARPEFTHQDWAKRGDRIVIRLPGLTPLLFTSSPADAQVVFTDRGEALRLGEAVRRIAPQEMIFGTEVITWLNGDNHALLRRIITPAFNGHALRGYEHAIIAAAETRIAQWPVHTPVRFQELMLELARDVIMSVVFGVTEPTRRARLEQALIDLDHALTGFGMKRRYIAAMARGGRWPRYPEMERINAEIDAITAEEITHRRAHPRGQERHDCLQVFLKIQQTEEAGALLDDHMIAVFQRMLLIAGYETTGVTLSWVAERIVRHPDVLAELDASLARGEDAYLDAVITETLRLRPALPATVRYTDTDFAMNDVLVPAGTIIVIYINAIHKRPDAYPDPDRFDPDRFLGVRPDPRTWLPFGGGAHRCLGGAFAMFESRVLLRTILTHRRFQTDDTPAERQDQHRNILLTPHHHARVTLLPRP